MAVGMESHGTTPKIEVAKGKDGEKIGSQVLLSGNFPRSFVGWGLVVGNQEGFFLSMEVGAKLSFPASWSALGIKENDSRQVCQSEGLSQPQELRLNRPPKPPVVCYFPK